MWSRHVRGLRAALVAGGLTAVANLPGAWAQRAPSPVELRAPSPGDSVQTANPAEPAVTAYPSAAVGDGPTTAGYNLSRWAEDWQRMRSPANRRDALDRLKYIGLDRQGSVYLTLSGEFRLRFNETSNPNLRRSRRQRQDIARLVAGADLHLGPHLRAFGELAHGGVSGPNIGDPAATLRNNLVVQQAFVEGDAKLGSGSVGLRFGRQEFTDGTNLLVSQRDNNTIRFALNGPRVWLRGRRARIDLYDFNFTTLGQGGVIDDTVDRDRRFSGATLGVVMPGSTKLYVEPFVWRLRNRRAVWGGQTGRETRLYYGVRLWGDAGPLTLDWTFDHQGGRFAGRTIDANQAFAAQTLRLGRSATAPRLGFHADYASGGGAYGRRGLGASTAPFGNNIYYSYQLFLTPTNLVAVAPNFTFSPHRRLRLTAEYQIAWRASRSDAVYRANGTAFAGTQASRGRRVANSMRGQAIWTLSPRVSLTARYEHLHAGPALTQAGYTGSDFVAGWLSCRL